MHEWKNWPTPKKRLFLQKLRHRRGASVYEVVSLHSRQREFLNLQCEEALYGGAAGGGKTYALLVWLAEGVHLPTYSGIYFRRTYPQLTRSNDSPIAKSFEIFPQLGGKFTQDQKRWRFPSGATVEFSHMQHEMNKYDHYGPSYHRIAFDELTQFTETQYTFLIGRLRKHAGFPLPIGLRGGTNPDGIGLLWVKARFVTAEAISAIKQLDVRQPSPEGQIFYTPAGRAFVPARVADNPSLDTEDYIERLTTQLDPVLAARLANGDWSISEGAQIDPGWFRYYGQQGEILIPILKQGRRVQGVPSRRMDRFATIDTAGSTKDKSEEDRGRSPSWSVCAIWDYWAERRVLFLRHVFRTRAPWLRFKDELGETLKRWQVPTAVIEDAHVAYVVAEELSDICEWDLVPPVLKGMESARVGSPRDAKLERAQASGLLKMLRAGRLFLPSIDEVDGDMECPVREWLPDFESELLAWTGRKGETADQVDVCSYAANYVRSNLVESWEPTWKR